MKNYDLQTAINTGSVIFMIFIALWLISVVIYVYIHHSNITDKARIILVILAIITAALTTLLNFIKLYL